MSNNDFNQSKNLDWYDPAINNPCANCNSQIEYHPWFEERGLCEDCEEDLMDYSLPPIYDIQDRVVQ